jgi:Serine/threonine protein kinase
VIGTPDFMSPEQVTDDPVTPASDVFSLGATLVFAATGRGPVRARPGRGDLYRIVQAAPDLDGVPAVLVEIVSACLVKDPAE